MEENIVPTSGMEPDFLLVQTAAKKYSEVICLCNIYIVYVIGLNNGDMLF